MALQCLVHQNYRLGFIGKYNPRHPSLGTVKVRRDGEIIRQRGKDFLVIKRGEGKSCNQILTIPKRLVQG